MAKAAADYAAAFAVKLTSIIYRRKMNGGCRYWACM